MSERWKPENGELYYYISTTGVVTPEKFNECDAGKTARCFCGNCFRTAVEAESAAEKFKAFLLSLHDNNLATNLQDKQDKFQDKPLPKLTAEVFNRPDCPENAKIAVVNDDGSAYWGSFNTARQNFRGGWNGENGSWFPIPGKWDSSDWQNSLIERPEKETKLPEWCKVGEWVYRRDEIHGEEYCKIITIQTEGMSAPLVHFDNGAKATYGSLSWDDVKQARLRPYNAAEMKALIGKVVGNEHGNMFLVTAFVAVDGGEVCVDGIVYNADDLLECYTINGSPCGVLEHLENGEWVK